MIRGKITQRAFAQHGMDRQTQRCHAWVHARTLSHTCVPFPVCELFGRTGEKRPEGPSVCVCACAQVPMSPLVCVCVCERLRVLAQPELVDLCICVSA